MLVSVSRGLLTRYLAEGGLAWALVGGDSMDTPTLVGEWGGVVVWVVDLAGTGQWLPRTSDGRTINLIL